MLSVVSQTDGAVQVGAPFLAWTKRQVWDFATSGDVPLSLTYSCERGGEAACGECPSCQDAEATPCWLEPGRYATPRAR